MILIAWLAYIAVALIVAANTFLEGEERQITWGFARIVGLMLSLVWPAVFLTVVGYVLLNRAYQLGNEIRPGIKKAP